MEAPILALLQPVVDASTQPLPDALKGVPGCPLYQSGMEASI
jgi:hypothetical protein